MKSKFKLYPTYIKPIADRLLAVIALIAVSPLLVTLAVAIRWRLGAPVLFKQVRPGLNGRPFVLVKFRTMIDARDAEGQLLDDAARLTPFGSWLRATSLDELPELWNIVRGEMSFVGPRPLVIGYLPLYSAEQSRRHDVRPGITGWAQVHGRNALGWPARFEHDVWYVDNISLWVDLRTLAKTLSVVFGRAGVTADNHATMPAFEGNESPKESMQHAA